MAKKTTTTSNKKLFILDTNVILHNPDSITSFADNEVLIPMDVIEELDKFKRDSDEKGRNAREAIRKIDQYRSKGSLRDGVELEGGGLLKVDTTTPKEMDQALSTSKVDNRIVMLASNFQKSGRRVIFVTKDMNARIKADALGVRTMDFEKQKVDFAKLYSGWREVLIDGESIDRFMEDERLDLKDDGLYANEMILLKNKADEKHTAIGRYDAAKKYIVKLKSGESDLYGIRTRNREQVMATELLLNNDIRLVTLLGSAGTGKTLIAMAAALRKVIDENAYRRVLVSRPIMPLGRDIGYLPGSKDEKIAQWMMPIFDNMEFILDHKKGNTEGVDSMVANNIIQLEAVTYMRGRSIAKQYIIIDEAQNLTPHEMKAIISRVGPGSKMVLTGDPYQIDNPYLDASSNGLTYAVEKLKGQPAFGNMFFTKNERSDIASLAAELL